MKTVTTAAVMAALILSACASSPERIDGQYISPMVYRDQSCDQIHDELVRIGDRVGQLSGQQRRRASQDKWAVGVGVVIFWPALFFLMRGDKAEELSRLKGEYEALNLAAEQKQCPGAQAA
jgi:hypothetical protein